MSSIKRYNTFRRLFLGFFCYILFPIVNRNLNKLTNVFNEELIYEIL